MLPVSLLPSGATLLFLWGVPVMAMFWQTRSSACTSIGTEALYVGFQRVTWQGYSFFEQPYAMQWLTRPGNCKPSPLDVIQGRVLSNVEGLTWCDRFRLGVPFRRLRSCS